MSKRQTSLSAKHARARLSYDGASGLFTWKYNPAACVAWNDASAGKMAGQINESGYVVIAINDMVYQAHRLAHLVETGYWPKGIVDHKDRVKTNNRWDNLRLATPSQNSANASIRKDNSSGFKGVTFKKQTGRWFARIALGGKTTHLGYFDTKEEAGAAYIKAANDIHGEFATDGKVAA